MKKKIIKENFDNDEVEVENYDSEEIEDTNEDNDDIENDNNDDDINEIDDDNLSENLSENLIDDNTDIPNNLNDDIDTEFIDDNYYTNFNISKKEYLVGNNRISMNRLTKYELVRILGERVQQLIDGAKPMIKNYKEFTYEHIAEYELLTNMIPFKLKRPLPNGKYEIWSLEELNKDHLLDLLEVNN
jgi:DNA-directed RNA polymerase subunit K/omega